MYKISVPILSDTFRKYPERSYEELMRFSPDRVFAIADAALGSDREKAKREIDNWKWTVNYLRKKGYQGEIGAWVLSFSTYHSEKCMRTMTGNAFAFGCPSDPEYIEVCKRGIKELAEEKVDAIMLDDDLRYGFLGAECACLCENHVKFICNEVGESLTADELAPLIMNGEKNKYRDAFLHANGFFLENYAKELRSALDEVSPETRLGACSCLTSWDYDGTDPKKLAKIFAGNTKPFVRGIGAPYWNHQRLWGNELQDTIELERMESVWTHDNEVEFFAEGDTFPRPRIYTSASVLELYDTALRASGATDGILKYGVDYVSDPDYEKAYAKYHERNSKLYGEIDKYFGGKIPCGVRVYESMKKISDVKVPNELGERAGLQDTFFCHAARTLAACTIPTTYEGKGICGIIFGENARHYGEEICERGLIMDMLAAKIFTDKGIDVGLKSVGSENRVEIEHFISDDNNISTINMATYDCELDEKAEILSDTTIYGKYLPMSYRYENAKGQRFLVLNMNPRTSHPNILQHYARSKQYAEQIKWLSRGKALPAYCYGNPKMYTICKKGENSLAVGLWNIFDDIAFEPVVELAEEYSEISFINCTGRLEGKKVYLSDIAAYEFAGFEVRK